MSRKKIIAFLTLAIVIIIPLGISYFNRDYAKRVTLTTIQALKDIKEAIYQPDFQITHGPYICSLNDKGEMYVVWKTNRPALSWVELASETTGQTAKFYETRSGLNASTKTLHTIKLDNLTSDSRYNYHIHSQEKKGVKHSMYADFGIHISSEDFRDHPYQFNTFSDSTAECSFAVFNDIHGNNQLMQELSQGVDFKKLDFVTLNGDMVGAVDNEEVLFSEYIDNTVNLFATETPIIWVRGNHEVIGAYADSMYDYFPNSNNQYYYMFMVGNIAFLVLDSGEYILDEEWENEYGKGLARFEPYRKEEAKWIAEVTQSDQFRNADFRIAFLHICPLYGQSTIKKELHEVFSPVLNNVNIDLMLSGHHHDYAYHPSNDQIDYPVIINGDESLLRCNITKDEIQISIRDIKLNKTITHSFPKKRK